MVTIRMGTGKIHSLVGIPMELDRWKSWVVVYRKYGLGFVIFLCVLVHLSLVCRVEGAVVKVCTGGLLRHSVGKGSTKGSLKKREMKIEVDWLFAQQRGVGEVWVKKKKEKRESRKPKTTMLNNHSEIHTTPTLAFATKIYVQSSTSTTILHDSLSCSSYTTYHNPLLYYYLSIPRTRIP